MPIPGERTETSPKWERHWTIFPRRINGRWYCRDYVYRYWCLSPGGGFWKYGDEFDVLRDSK
jgi:hypothetical protein